MSKPNLRSFRYSDRVSEIIMSSPGSSMNEKFERLVLDCHDKLPEREKALAAVERQIARKREEYAQLCKELRDVDSLMGTLRDLKRLGDVAVKKAELISLSLPGQVGFDL